MSESKQLSSFDDDLIDKLSTRSNARFVGEKVRAKDLRPPSNKASKDPNKKQRPGDVFMIKGMSPQQVAQIEKRGQMMIIYTPQGSEIPVDPNETVLRDPVMDERSVLT